MPAQPVTKYDSRPSQRLVKLAIACVYFAASRSIGRLFGWTSGTGPVVLTYHSIHADEVTDFDRQMKYLKQRFRAVFADDSNAPGTQPAVAVTFDDALQNVFDLALPMLAKHEIPSTVFVPTGYMGVAPGWIDSAHNPQRAAGIVASEETLRAIDSRLVRLGSHTVTHANLGGLDELRLSEELSRSKKALEELTGASIGMLSLPYGSWTQKVIATARREGYDRVFANVPVGRGGHLSHLISRIDVSPRDWTWEFRLKIQGAYEWMALAIPLKREVLRFLGKAREA